MFKFFKLLTKILLWLLAILAVILIVGYLTMGLWIKPLVSTVVPKITQTSASLESADISLFSGRVTLKGLKVGNPAGFTTPTIFELGEISVRFQPKTLFTNKIVVDQVLIRNTQITAEFNQRGFINLMALNDNIQKTLNQEKTTKQEPVAQKANTKSDKAVVIKDLQILNTSMRVAMTGSSATLNLPNIQRKNIGEKTKITWEQGIQLLTDMLTVEPVKEMGKMGQKALRSAFDTIEKHTKNSGALNSLKSAFSELNMF